MADSTGVTTFAFDNVNRTIGRTDPGSLVQAITYDVASQRKTLTDPDGGVRTYAFDLDSRLASVQFATGGVTTFGYDFAARETSQTFATGAQMYRGYDSNSQVTSTVWLETGGNQWVTNSYDPNGSRLTAADILGNLTIYTMDAKDPLTHKQHHRPQRSPVQLHLRHREDNILTTTERKRT